MSKNIIILFLFLSFTTFSFAQTGEEELDVQYKKADKELNLVYNKLKSKLSKTEKIELTEAQKAWIKFRDLDCKFISKENSEGGVIANKMKTDCLTQSTLERIKVLKSLIEEF